MAGLWTSLIACFLLAAFTTVLSCADGGGGGGQDGDDATDDDDAGSCDIDESSMVEIPFSFDGSDCGALGLAIVVDRLYANSSLTAFKVAGQFSIDNDNVLFLRTAGVSQQSTCFDKIENSGTFEIGAAYLECTTNIQVDVVASTDADASSFCGFWVQSGVACEDEGDDDVTDDDNDDDTVDDDTSGDDDYVEECEDWYAECGVDDAGACAALDSYTGLGECYNAALGNLFDCLLAAGCSDAEAISDCYTDFASAVGGC